MTPERGVTGADELDQLGRPRECSVLAGDLADNGPLDTDLVQRRTMFRRHRYRFHLPTSAVATGHSSTRTALDETIDNWPERAGRFGSVGSVTLVGGNCAGRCPVVPDWILPGDAAGQVDTGAGACW
ncbi:hypothetical protein [Nocardia asiatica]|uniref:hypothetical protein n=1 Tax=Nocardia asiatica TaxID=209252 RepID=UPI003EE38F39